MPEESISKQLKKAIGQLLEQALQDFRNMEINKKTRLLKLAKDMENAGYPKDMICSTICKAVAGEGISRDTIERTLPDEYKKPKLSTKDPQMRLEDDKKVIEVTTNGSSSTKPEFKPRPTPKPIDEDIVRQQAARIEELEILVKKSMETNPNMGFQSASNIKIKPTTTDSIQTTSVLTEVIFDLDYLKKFWPVQRYSMKVVYCKLEGNKIIGFESDTERNSKSGRT